MLEIPRDQVISRLRAENPWWATGQIGSDLMAYRRRAYLPPLHALARPAAPRRAVLLMGPRRVGKTVLLHHLIHELIAEGVPPRQIAFVSVDHPLYNDASLAGLVELVAEAAGADTAAPRWVCFDEVQYRTEWEVHLKQLVDTSASTRFIASGSAAAALRLKSNESGAGRFTDFLLPPVTFYEYRQLLDRDNLNRDFIDYLNFGGYPEVIFSEAIRENPARFVRSDIIDKVLLRDLPSLYGIQDIPELNRLFTTLAFNTAQEVSLDALSRSSGVAKNTLKKYIEYLEAAFLLRVVHRIDRNARHFKRAVAFKVYLTNPSMRAALFAPLTADDDMVGHLVETALVSQWLPGAAPIYYARWATGEVDVVELDAAQRPVFAMEVKWSDRIPDLERSRTPLREFAEQHEIPIVFTTTRTMYDHQLTSSHLAVFRPAALTCYQIGQSLLTGEGPFAQIQSLSRALTNRRSTGT
jgi:uncharacterized protein